MYIVSSKTKEKISFIRDLSKYKITDVIAINSCIINKNIIYRFIL